MTVLVIVTDAFKDVALPFTVTIATLPAVENETPAEARILPTMWPLPAPLTVAAVRTRQNTFLAGAPPARMMLRGAPAAPTVSELAVWNTKTALASPCASRVRSEPVIRNEQLGAL